ncbi:hypothetical protein B0G74_2284 [Paraburkholderia sp. BL9I2N2]|nr:hypothetical protein B0G74_2284 [Paraburkholderia sp. BL9I2N2]
MRIRALSGYGAGVAAPLSRYVARRKVATLEQHGRAVADLQVLARDRFDARTSGVERPHPAFQVLGVGAEVIFERFHRDRARHRLAVHQCGERQRSDSSRGKRARPRETEFPWSPHQKDPAGNRRRRELAGPGQRRYGTRAAGLRSSLPQRFRQRYCRCSQSRCAPPYSLPSSASQQAVDVIARPPARRRRAPPLRCRSAARRRVQARFPFGEDRPDRVQPGSPSRRRSRSHCRRPRPACRPRPPARGARRR